jgi:hypothetical protein
LQSCSSQHSSNSLNYPIRNLRKFIHFDEIWLIVTKIKLDICFVEWWKSMTSLDIVHLQKCVICNQQMWYATLVEWRVKSYDDLNKEKAFIKIQYLCMIKTHWALKECIST